MYTPEERENRKQVTQEERENRKQVLEKPTVQSTYDAAVILTTEYR